MSDPRKPLTARIHDLGPAAAAVLLAAAGGAQSTRVVPAFAAGADANAAAHLPFGYGAIRMQQLVAGSAVCRKVATLTQVSMRRNTGTIGKYGSRPYRGRTIRLRVLLSITRSTLRSMSHSFAANRSLKTSVVFDSRFNLPTLPVTAQTPAPWAPQVRFARPYVYVRPPGDLLIEFVLRDAPGAYLYGVDAHGFTGKVEPFGRHGRFHRGAGAIFGADPSLLLPGGSLDVFARIPADFTPPPAAVFLGASRRSFGRLRLPFDLTRFGASGNALLTSIDLALPMRLRFRKGSGLAGRVSLPLASDRALRALRFYAQAVYASPPSNALGLVFSNGLALYVGAGDLPVTRTLFSLDPDAAQGEFGFHAGTVLGGPVLRLTGTFN